MKRIRLGAKLPALLFIAPLGGGFALLHGCIPAVDTSGLPPGDASAPVTFDGSFPQLDAALSDATLADGPGHDANEPEANANVGNVIGVVVDYTQGGGKGVVAGATVSVLNGPTATTDANGRFVLSAVPAGQVQINVGKPSTVTQTTTYSTTQVVTALGVGQTLSVFPVLHEGCADTITFSGPTQNGGALSSATCGARGLGVNIQNFFQVKLQNGSLVDTTTSAVYSGAVRVEMIPLAYPGSDLSWALALPGVTTPVDTIGGAELRVVAAQTGAPLQLAAGATATITVPVYRAPGQGETFAPWFFDAVTGTWKQESAAGAAVSNPHAVIVGNTSVEVVDLTVPHFTWWAVTRAVTDTTCVTGALTANGAPAAGVWVHSSGTNYLGASSAVTDANGSFCLDVKAAQDDAGTRGQFAIVAGYAQGSGAAFAVATGPQQSARTSSGGSCATHTGCSPLNGGQPFVMTPLTGACVAGSVHYRSDGGPVTSPLNVQLEGIKLDPAHAGAGMTTTAYVGSVTPGAGGTFCGLAPPGANFRFVDPAGSNYAAPSSCLGLQPITAPATGGSPSCAAGGCADAGDIFYGCY